MLASLALLGSVRVRAAEWDGDFHLGYVPTGADDNALRSGGVVVRDYEHENTGYGLGLRFTEWPPDPTWFGLAREASSFGLAFREEPSRQACERPSILSFSGLAMCRIGALERARFPGGRVEAHAGAGPACSDHPRYLRATARRSIAEPYDSFFDLGSDIRVGTGMSINAIYRLVLAYRYAEYHTTLAGDGVRYSPRFTLEHVLLGLSVRSGAIWRLNRAGFRVVPLVSDRARLPVGSSDASSDRQPRAGAVAGARGRLCTGHHGAYPCRRREWEVTE